ncbi:MAG TPA: hypothetical protein VNO70_15015 [Blastocatellia bacterium]|nr:hypothetical protein [Blastocatellia bacterium]
MIRPEKYASALHALQQVIIRARFLASKEEHIPKVTGLLDAAEELPRLIAAADDRTEEFAASLKEISERYPYCRSIFADFNGETANPDNDSRHQMQLV